MDSKHYWNHKIIEWEDSMRDGSPGLSFIEKLAAHFRGPVKLRSAMAIETLRPFVQGKTVLELGCGSGYFAFDICDTNAVKKVTGVDISENAIQRAKEIGRQRGLQGRCEFSVADITEYALPSADITVGLGFLDYLTAGDIESLFRRLRSPYFLFSFSERKFSLLRFVHRAYLLTQRCPKHFYYTKAEIRRFIGDKRGAVRFTNDRRLSFACLVHNLPPHPEGQGCTVDE